MIAATLGLVLFVTALTDCLLLFVIALVADFVLFVMAVTLIVYVLIVSPIHIQVELSFSSLAL